MKIQHSRLTSAQTKNLLDFFIAGTTARTAAIRCEINRNTANKFYDLRRQIIAQQLENDSLFLDGEIAADESYFGSGRFGKRGRGAAGKTRLFGLSAPPNSWHR